MKAAEQGRLRLMRFLISKGAKVSREQADKALKIACLNGYLNIAKFLIQEMKATVDNQCLQNTVKNDHLDLMYYLL